MTRTQTASPRFLHIGTGPDTFAAIPLKPDALPALYEAGIVYDCGDGHDLHIDPDEQWGIDAVEALVLAIHDGARE